MTKLTERLDALRSADVLDYATYSELHDLAGELEQMTARLRLLSATLLSAANNASGAKVTAEAAYLHAFGLLSAVLDGQAAPLQPTFDPAKVRELLDRAERFVRDDRSANSTSALLAAVRAVRESEGKT